MRPRRARWKVAALLESLGVSDGEERVYRALLRDPEARIGDLALTVGVDHLQIRSLLTSLEVKGLISRSSGKHPGYVPVIPDVAVEGLIQRRQKEIELIRALLPQLRREYHNPEDRENPMEFVEVVSGRKAVSRWFAHLQKTATRSVLVFDKPPYAQPDASDGQPINDLEFDRLKDSIEYRAIYSEDAVAYPGRARAIHEYVRAGEQARVSSRLPMKLAIADHRLAILPLIADAPSQDAPAQVESAIVVHPSSLLDALVTLFDVLWERALPLASSEAAAKDLGSEGEDEEWESLLALLTAGLTDEVIARQMGISIRTVRRRVRHLMDRLGAVSRFQAGIQAAKRGWL